MKIADLVSLMESIAPLAYAEPWDKVGLLVGNRERAITGPTLLTIDLTEAVLAEAVESKASAIVAYHPAIFEPLTKVTDATPRQRVILRAIEAGLAIYSPHTALDAIPGGVNDWLCEGLSIPAGSDSQNQPPGKIYGDIRALSAHGKNPASQEVKVVTFVPAKDAEKLRDALASAGAGIIGNYQLCSFRTSGVGSFLAGDGAKPTIGTPGRIEQVEEFRLEMVSSKSGLPLALETLRRFHPYEEPAIDVYELAPQPRRTIGSGRRLILDRPATVPELAQRLKAHIKRDRVRFALANDAGTNTPIRAVGVCAGSGSSLSKLAKHEGCEVYVTGEMNHHEVLGALNAGMHVILGGHTSTERGYLPRLAARMNALSPQIRAMVSTVDRDVLVTV
jgi:dinuclear metal center YbgI/SA1388 family protein